MSKNIVMKALSGGEWVQMHPITKSDNVFFIDGDNLTEKMATKSDVHSHPYRLNTWLPTPAEIGALDTDGGIITGSLQVNGTITAANGIALKIGEGLEFITQGDYFPGATYYDARIIRMVDVNGTGGNVDGGLVVEGYTPTDGARQELLTARTNGEFKFKGNDIWHGGNFDPNSKQGSLGPTVDIQYRNATFYGDLIPDTTLARSIGSDTKWVKEAWIESLHLGPNTLYIGDTPILGTDQDNIIIQADLNQTITMKTSGVGETKVISERGVELSTSGLNADVVIQSTGAGGRVTFGAHTSINYTAPDIYYNGRVTFSQGVVFNGENVEINAEQVTTKDNIIHLNDGEVGSGVTAGQAGVRIDRGDLADQVFLWDESKNGWCLGSAGGSLKIVATEDDVSSLQTQINGKSDIHSHPYRSDTWVPSWGQVTGKPSTFTPSAHNQAISTITGLQVALDGKVDDSQVLTNVPAGAKFTDTVYTHPSSHPASMITQSATYRFVTDTEKSTWNAKANAHGHPYRPDTWVPTWGQVTGKPTTFTPSVHYHDLRDLTNYSDVIVTYRDTKNIDDVGTYIMAKDDTGWFGGTKPPGAHNGFGVFSMHLHVGEYTGQIGLSSADDKMYFRSKDAGDWRPWKALSFEGHGHAISNVSGLQSALDGKSAVGHTHPIPETPSIASLGLLEEGDRVTLSFSKLGSEVDYYEIYSSIGDESDYALIGKVDHADAEATVVFHDYTYDRNTQIFYKAVAVRNGVVSSEVKSNITVSNPVGDISNLKVTESTGTILVTYDLPDDRRLKEVEVYIGSSATTTVAKPASPYYKGPNNFAFYEVPDADLDKHFKVWVDTVTRT